MIRTETKNINGFEYTRTYSDAGLKLEREGVLYDEAIDPAGTDRIYTESAVPVDDEITAEQFLEMVEGVL